MYFYGNTIKSATAQQEIVSETRGFPDLHGFQSFACAGHTELPHRHGHARIGDALASRIVECDDQMIFILPRWHATMHCPLFMSDGMFARDLGWQQTIVDIDAFYLLILPGFHLVAAHIFRCASSARSH